MYCMAAWWYNQIVSNCWVFTAGSAWNLGFKDIAFRPPRCASVPNLFIFNATDSSVPVASFKGLGRPTPSPVDSSKDLCKWRLCYHTMPYHAIPCLHIIWVKYPVGCQHLFGCRPPHPGTRTQWHPTQPPPTWAGARAPADPHRAPPPPGGDRGDPAADLPPVTGGPSASNQWSRRSPSWASQ